MKLCECGCGQQVKPGNRYIRYHHRRLLRPHLNLTKIKEEYEKTPISIKELCVKYGVSYGWLYPRLRKLKTEMKDFGWKSRKRIAFFPSPDLSYILGVMKGDGYVYSSEEKYKVELSTRDHEFAEAFKSVLEKMGLRCWTRIRKLSLKNPSWHDAYVVTASSVNFVRKYRSLTIEQIERLVTSSYESIVAFIRGFYDSEGSVSVKGNGHDLRMGCTDKDVMLFLSELTEDLGYNFHLYKLVSKNPRWKPLWALILSNKAEVHRFLKEVKPNIRRKAVCPCGKNED